MGRSPSCDENGVKKGPWTPDEDQKLMDYITRNGHGSWRALPKLAGLNRCGKSCRLRWTNYLRPDIKRGNFSDDEQKLIINLHAVLGNKWSTIAGHLPGRTDNEIKNLWNTHLKKKLVHMGIDPVTHRPRTDLNNVLSNLPHLIAAANFATAFLSTRAPASWPDVMSAAGALRSLPCSYSDATQQAKIQALILQLLGSNNNAPSCGIGILATAGTSTTNTNTSYSSSMEADIYSLLGLASCSSSSVVVPEHHQCDVDDYLRAIEELESAAGFTTPQHHILHSSTGTANTFPDTDHHHHHRLLPSTAATTSASAGKPDVSMIINNNITNIPTNCYQLPQLVVPNSPTSSPALPHTTPNSPKPLSHYKITQPTKLNPVHNPDNITSNPNSSTNSTNFQPAACSWVDLIDDETTDSQYYWNHIMDSASSQSLVNLVE